MQRGSAVYDDNVHKQITYEPSITQRETDVLNCVAKGIPNKLIAEQLHISEHTVKGDIKRILSKLHAGDRTEAAMIALRRGLFDL
jgi:DNA-binding NarL/FixJ family response regulator